MKTIKRTLFGLFLAGVLMTSCAKDVEENINHYESMSLKAWVNQNNPDVVGNFREVDSKGSGYYFDILDPGDISAESIPIGKKDVWVHFKYTARDLNGNIVLTRDAHNARLLNTFTKYTHYVPYFRFVGDENVGMMEGAYLAMRDTLTMSKEYFEKYRDERGFNSETYRLRIGSKVVLYCPSILIGNSVNGSGGYEGQTSLSAQRPVRVEIEVCDTTTNPLKVEGNIVDKFCEDNGGLQIYTKEEDGVDIPTDPNDIHHPYNPQSKRWVSASDTIAQVYINHRYDPRTDRFNYPNRYNVGLEPYNGEDLDQKIADVLMKRFHKDSVYIGADKLKADTVKLDGTAKIWYIGRFTDGFIFDTNIDEVKELIYGKDFQEGKVLDYTPKSGGLIKGFYYAVPQLKYGQWASFITVSTFAYGVAGKQGMTSTSSSGGMTSYDYFNYLNYINNYYGGGYMGGYMDGYYGGFGGFGGGYGYGYGGGYYGDYYGDYYGMGAGNPATTVKTVTTEIPSFEPLIFQFYIEPRQKK